MSRVVAVVCDGYDFEKVYACVKRGLAELGGIGAFVKPEEKVLVKPNFLAAEPAEKAVTVHPSVLKSVLRLLFEEGYAKVSFGDSPAVHSCRTVVKTLKMEEPDFYGATLAPMVEEVRVKNPGGKTAKEFWFSKEIVEADALIGVCKMKTHALTRITGAVKNFYGAVNGKRKTVGHLKYPNDSVFSRQLCDMHLLLKPRLHIMDGIVAMEGNGPAGGTPVPMNVLLFSSDPVALDTVFAWLVNVDPLTVPTCVQGQAMGVGTDRESEIEVVLADGDEVKTVSRTELFKRLGNAEFDVDRTPVKKGLFARYSRTMTNLQSGPKIDPEKCVKCGVCVEHCPVPEKAVDFKNGRDAVPVHDYKKCIRCFCCQEMCPQSAIYVVKGVK